MSDHATWHQWLLHVRSCYMTSVAAGCWITLRDISGCCMADHATWYQWLLHGGSHYVKYKPYPPPTWCTVAKVTPFVIWAISICNMKCIQTMLPQNFVNSGMEELNDLYSSSSIVWVISLRMMRWVGHVARGGGERCLQGFGGETWGKETTWETQA